MRTHRPSSFVPYWVRTLGVLAALFVVGGWCLASLPAYRLGAKTCRRCGAVESGPEVFGVWLGSERPVSPGRALVEGLAGRCESHPYESTGCWSVGLGTVACTMRPTGEPAYELCALADSETAQRLAVRLVDLPAGERERILLDALLSGEPEPETVEAARRWVARVLQEQGWHDLEGP